MTEAEKSANNWAGSLNKLRNSWSELVNSFINSDNAITVIQSVDKIIQNLTDSAATGGLKTLSNAITGLIKLVGDLTDKFGTFPTLLASIGAVGSFNKMGFFKVVEDDATKGGNAVALFGKKLKDVIKDYQEADAGRIGENKISQALSGIIGFNQSDLSAIEKYNSLIESGVDKTEAFEKSMVGASNGAKSFVLSGKAATAGITGLSISEKAATIATEALGVALNTALSFGIGLLIQAIITGITKLVNAEKEAEEKAREMQEQAAETARNYLEEKQSLEDLTNEYVSLATTTSDLASQKQKLLDIQDKMNESISTQTDKVDLLNKSLAENLRLTAEQEYKDAQKIISENQTEVGIRHGEVYFTKEAEKVGKNIEQEFLDILNVEYGDIAKSWGNYLLPQGNTLNDMVENYQEIINLYASWEGHNNEILDQMNAIQRNAEKTNENQIKTNEAYNKAVKIVEDYDAAYNSDLGGRVGEILESARDLSVVLSESDSKMEKYITLQNIEDLELQARNLAGANEVLKQQVDSVFNAINTGSQSSIKSIGDLRSAWFESLNDIQKNTISNIDKMDKAIKTAIDGGKLSSSDFWELAELDTDDIIKNIKLVNGEYQLSEKELIRLKDEYIQKQIESLKLQQLDIESKREAQRQDLILAQQELESIERYNSARYGSANLNNPKYREYTKQLEDANSKVDTIKNNIKELGDEHARNNILIREYNSRLGYSVEQASALAEAYHQNFVKAIDDAIDKVNDRKQALEDEKDVLNDEKDILNEQLELLEEQQKAIEEQIENYKTVVGVIEEEIKKQTDALKEQQEAEEAIIQAKIDALKEEREQKEAEKDILEKELAVQEKLRDLEKAKNTKVRTFSSARGWHYDVDKEAVANAQSALTEAQKTYNEALEKREYENKIKLLEEEKEAISKSYGERIKEYEDYTAEWKNILEEQSNAEELRLADEILGVKWREDIKNRDVNILNSFRTTFKQYNTQLDNLVNGEIATLKKSIKAKEEQIAAVDAQIEALDKEVESWNKYKQDVEDAVDEINNKYSNLDGALATTANNTSLSLDNMEIRLWDFKEHYKSYMDEAIAKANEFAAAASQEVDTGWMEDITGKVYITLQQWQDTLEELSKYNLHINSNGDAELHKRGSYANGGVVDYTGIANVHGTPIKSEVAFNSAQAKQLYNMVRTGSFENLVASKAIEGFRLANVATSNNNNNSTSVNIQNMNINGVQNPVQFAKEFNRNMEQYLQNEMIKSRVR